MSNPISFGAFLGDWARYIPRDTPRSRSWRAAFWRRSPPSCRSCSAWPPRPSSPPRRRNTWTRRAELRRRPAGRLAGLVLRARLPHRPDRRHVHRHDLAVRHRPGLLQRLPPVLAACRRRCSSASLSIVFIFVGRFAANLIAEHLHLRHADHHLHGALDGDHDARLRDAPRLVRPRGAAGVQPPPARRPLLVHPRLELARAGRLAGRRRARR